MTRCLSASVSTLLAIEDTTTLAYTHRLKDRLGDLGAPKEKSSRGFHIHTTLLMDAEKERTLGLIAQERWCRRQERKRQKKASTNQKIYRERELQMGEEYIGVRETLRS